MFDLATIPSTELTTLHGAGQAANKYAQAGAFDDYLARKAPNTVIAQRNDLAVFCAFLGAVHAGAAIPVAAVRLQRDPEAWRGVTWGLVEAFIKWQVQQGHAVASVNRRLSTVKMYCKLATKAGVHRSAGAGPDPHRLGLRRPRGQAHQPTARDDACGQQES